MKNKFIKKFLNISTKKVFLSVFVLMSVRCAIAVLPRLRSHHNDEFGIMVTEECTNPFYTFIFIMTPPVIYGAVIAGLHNLLHQLSELYSLEGSI